MGKRKSKYELGDFKFKVKRSSAGLGLFTESPIPKGACIIEYKGRELSEAEQYTVISQYLFEVTKKKTIDGKDRSNTARYINHSCRPNSEIETYKGRVYIMARRNIREGEELNYDYGKEFFDEYIKPKGCKCEKCMEKSAAKKASRT
jgi:uncharacterized protein